MSHTHAPVPVPGVCPNCRNAALIEFPIVESINNGVSSAGVWLMVAGAVTLICGIGLVLLPVGLIIWIFGMFQPKTRVIGVSRQCQACGARWQV